MRRRRPHEAAPLQPLGEQTQALAVPPQRLQEIAAPSPKDEDLAAERVLPEPLLDQHGQAVEALAHVSVAGTEPHTRAGRRRDHRPVSAAKTRLSGSTATVSPTPITIPFGSLISIARSPA